MNILRKEPTSCACGKVQSAMLLVEVPDGKKTRQEWHCASPADPQYCKNCKTYTHEAHVKEPQQ